MIIKQKQYQSKQTNKKRKGHRNIMKLSNLLAYELIPTNDNNIIEFDDILS